MTFDPHPPRVVRPDKAPPLLMTTAQRLEAIEARRRAGRGDRPLHARTVTVGPRDVRPAVLVDWLHVSEVWVGANFLFGRDRAGTFSLLRTLGARYGFNAEKIDPVRYKDFVVSSTRVRRLMSEARVDEAGALLGHHVLHRRHRGRAATSGDGRSAFHRERLPRTTNCCRRSGSTPRRPRLDGIVYPSVTNIGVRPTVDDSGRVSIETHVFNLDRDLYGAPIRVGFVQRLRDERAFESLDALKAQIQDDCDRARVLFERLSL